MLLSAMRRALEEGKSGGTGNLRLKLQKSLPSAAAMAEMAQGWGSMMVKVVPSPTLLVTLIRPCMSSTIFPTM